MIGRPALYNLMDHPVDDIDKFALLHIELQVETMHAIFLDYLCDASAPSVVSNAAFEFLNR